jgi:tetratricopeptide (TPR) repeat protein
MRRISIVLTAVVCVLAVTGCAEDPERAKQAALESGNRFVEQQKPQEAIVEYRRALQIDGKFGEAQLQLAKAYEQTNQRNQAAEAYVRAADLLPNDDAVQVRAGQYLLELGRSEDARSRAEAVLRRDSRNFEAQMLLGQAAASMKNLDGAISEIEEAIQIAPDDTRGQTTLGLLQMAKGNADLARAAFERAVELQPGSIEARLSLVGYYWAMNDAPAVELQLKEVLNREPRNRTALRALATFYVRTNRIADAEPYFKRLTEDAKDGRSLLALADYYVFARRFDEATRTLDSLTQDPQVALIARTKLAMIAYDRNRRADAHRQIDAVLKEQPKNPTALLIKARFAIAESRSDEALQLLQQAIAAEPGAAAPHYYAGLLYMESNRMDDAAAAFGEALRLNPQLDAAHLQLARVNLARGNAAQSAQMSRQVLSKVPADPMSRLVLVDSLLAQGDVAAAERELRPLESNFPNAAPVHVRRGRVVARQGDMERARKSFARAHELEPKSVDALSGLVAADLAANRMNDARARIEKQLVVSPADARLLLLAGNVYVAAGDLAKAEAVTLRAVGAAPSVLAGYDLLGRIYLLQGKLDQAQARFEELARQDRLANASNTIVGMLLQAQNKTDEARKRFEQVVERDPKSVAAANNLAWIYAESGGDLERAVQLATRARQAAPQEAKVADTLGWVHYKRNLPSLAIPEFEQAIALEPTNPVFRYHLGLAHLAAGETAKGTASLQRALALQANFPGADDARQLLSKHKGS